MNANGGLLSYKLHCDVQSYATLIAATAMHRQGTEILVFMGTLAQTVIKEHNSCRVQDCRSRHMHQQEPPVSNLKT